MQNTNDKVLVEFMKEVRLLKRQLTLIKNNLNIFNEDDFNYMGIALELLDRGLTDLKERGLSR